VIRAELVALEPTLTAHHFAPLGEQLVALLGSLAPADWERPTVCPAWQVRDIASHLLDSALRRLAFGRDGHTPPVPGSPLLDYADLLSHLDTLNARWVEATRRLSPRLLTELMAWVEPQLAAHLAALDPWGPAPFAVSWAGESHSLCWFDVARELTERWHHQQQIRLAVGADPLVDGELSAAIFDTFLRALPHRYREVAAPVGTVVGIHIRGERDHYYAVLRAASGWELRRGWPEPADASLALAEQPAWLLLTKGMPGAQARAVAAETGQRDLLDPFFSTLAVMA
jgi:uncharacterized protein (TIGR03083 family)